MAKTCCGENSKKGEEINDLRDFLQTISDTNRLRILCLLSEGELCVCEIFNSLELSQNLVSHHLARLEKAGLLKKRREGVYIIYQVDKEKLKQYKELFDKIIKD